MEIEQIFEFVRNIFYGLALAFAILYSCLILFIRRFHNRNNIFILNICINIISATIYYTMYFYIVEYDMSNSMCTLLHYAFNLTAVQVPFAFVTFTIHRSCIIIYHTKVFFKTKIWVVLCISIQWTVQFLISLPFVFAIRRVRFFREEKT